MCIRDSLQRGVEESTHRVGVALVERLAPPRLLHLEFTDEVLADRIEVLCATGAERVEPTLLQGETQFRHHRAVVTPPRIDLRLLHGVERVAYLAELLARSRRDVLRPLRLVHALVELTAHVGRAGKE